MVGTWLWGWEVGYGRDSLLGEWWSQQQGWGTAMMDFRSSDGREQMSFLAQALIASHVPEAFREIYLTEQHCAQVLWEIKGRWLYWCLGWGEVEREHEMPIQAGALHVDGLHGRTWQPECVSGHVLSIWKGSVLEILLWITPWEVVRAPWGPTRLVELESQLLHVPHCLSRVASLLSPPGL